MTLNQDRVPRTALASLVIGLLLVVAILSDAGLAQAPTITRPFRAESTYTTTYLLVAPFDGVAQAVPAEGELYFGEGPPTAPSKPIFVMTSEAARQDLAAAKRRLIAIDKALRFAGYIGISDFFTGLDIYDRTDPWSRPSHGPRDLYKMATAFFDAQALMDVVTAHGSLGAETGRGRAASSDPVQANDLIVKRFKDMFPRSSAVGRTEVMSILTDAACDVARGKLIAEGQLPYRIQTRSYAGRAALPYSDLMFTSADLLPSTTPDKGRPPNGRRISLEISRPDLHSTSQIPAIIAVSNYWDTVEKQDLYTVEDDAFIEWLSPPGDKRSRSLRATEVVGKLVGEATAAIDSVQHVQAALDAVSEIYGVARTQTINQTVGLDYIAPRLTDAIVNKSLSDAEKSRIAAVSLNAATREIGDLPLYVRQFIANISSGSETDTQRKRFEAKNLIVSELSAISCAGRPCGEWYAQFKLSDLTADYFGDLFVVREVPDVLAVGGRAVPLSVTSADSMASAVARWDGLSDYERPFEQGRLQLALATSALINTDTVQQFYRSVNEVHRANLQLSVEEIELARGLRNLGIQGLEEYRLKLAHYNDGRVFAADTAEVLATYTALGSTVARGGRVAMVAPTAERTVTLSLDSNTARSLPLILGKVMHLSLSANGAIPLSREQATVIGTLSGPQRQAVMATLTTIYQQYLNSHDFSVEVAAVSTNAASAGGATVAFTVLQPDTSCLPLNASEKQTLLPASPSLRLDADHSCLFLDAGAISIGFYNARIKP